jgi:ABC-type transport system involved in cytochrome bd biosynthesis fused ATPase/permease subunit
VLAPEVYFPLRNAASLFHASADGGAALAELIEIRDSGVEPAPEGTKKVNRIASIEWSTWNSPYSSGQLSHQALLSHQILTIRGPSGLGKTTFLNSIVGLNASALITINGEGLANYSKRSLYDQIGWIPQNPSLLTGTLRQQFTHLNPALTDAAIEKMLSDVGLHLSTLSQGLNTLIGGAGEKSAEISGGQRRRIAIARALAASPSLIIADEPTADLDPVSAGEILRILAKQAALGAIVIAVLHAPDQQIKGSLEVELVER